MGDVQTWEPGKLSKQKLFPRNPKYAGILQKIIFLP
jgi:hypothetical protein